MGRFLPLLHVGRCASLPPLGASKGQEKGNVRCHHGGRPPSSSGCLPCGWLNGLSQVPIGLKPHPELRRCLQQTTETQRRVRADAPLSEHNLVQTVQRDPKPPRRFHLTDAHWLQKLL